MKKRTRTSTKSWEVLTSCWPPKIYMSSFQRTNITKEECLAFIVASRTTRQSTLVPCIKIPPRIATTLHTERRYISIIVIINVACDHVHQVGLWSKNGVVPGYHLCGMQLVILNNSVISPRHFVVYLTYEKRARLKLLVY